MGNKKNDVGKVEKIVQIKREKQQQKAQQKEQQKLPPGSRPLTEEERNFVEHWCVHMRGIDRAMYMHRLAKLVNKLSEAEMQRQRGGLVKPDGSILS